MDSHSLPGVQAPEHGTKRTSNDLGDRCRALLRRRGVSRQCDLRVERRNRWTVFEGRVDSHGTKVSLFGLVPDDAGAKWIIDKLYVGRSR